MLERINKDLEELDVLDRLGRFFFTEPTDDRKDLLWIRRSEARSENGKTEQSE